MYTPCGICNSIGGHRANKVCILVHLPELAWESVLGPVSNIAYPVIHGIQKAKLGSCLQAGAEAARCFYWWEVTLMRALLFFCAVVVLHDQTLEDCSAGNVAQHSVVRGLCGQEEAHGVGGK